MITISVTFTVLQMLLTWCRTPRTVPRKFPTINWIISSDCINRLLFVMEKPCLCQAANYFFHNMGLKFNYCHSAQSEGLCQNLTSAIVHSWKSDVKI